MCGAPARGGGEAADGTLAHGGGEAAGGAPAHRGGAEEEARQRVDRWWSEAEGGARGPVKPRIVSAARKDWAERGFVSARDARGTWAHMSTWDDRPSRHTKLRLI
jgi:hypothetical protein